MFRHKVRLLLCVSIFALLQVTVCYAQETFVCPLAQCDICSDGYSPHSEYQEFATDYTSNVEHGSFGTSSPWFVRFGVASFLFGESAVLRANDVVVPGASLRISDETTFGFDIGYQLSPRWTATFTTGVPPNLDLDGTGPFEGAQYGTTRYAPLVFALQRHFFLSPKTSVYVGGGVNYTFHYDSIDGLVQDLDVDNNVAGVVQLGIERRLNNRVSLFADAKKAFYETEATGNVFGAPIRADITANPTVLFFGLKFDL